MNSAESLEAPRGMSREQLAGPGWCSEGQFGLERRPTAQAVGNRRISHGPVCAKEREKRVQGMGPRGARLKGYAEKSVSGGK